jgi:RNA polymerase sigma factor (sigma-70 family)
MRNIVIDQARLKRRQVPQIRLAAEHDDSDPRSADPASAVELRPVLLDALRTLAPQQRMIVVLRYFDDRSENEVAGLLGVSTGTVKSTASRAMAHLREQPGISGLITQAETDTTIRRIRYA